MTVYDLAAAFRSVLDAVPAPLLWLAAWVGHGYLLMVGLNVLYAHPLPHKLLKVMRKVDLLTIVAGLPLFWYALDLHDTGQLPWEADGPRFLLAPYVVFCGVVGLVVAPTMELRYLLRRPAPQLARQSSAMVDVAGELGYTPAGKGKHARLCGLPLNRVFDVEFNEKTLALPQLPAAWDGLTILHLTDLHLCGTPDRAFYQYIVDRCMRAGVPDIVALTGDVVDSPWHHRWVVPVLGRLRWNEAAFAILGNHDAWRDPSQIRRRLRRVGMRVLGNGWDSLAVRGEPLTVIGHEGPWFAPGPDLAGCPAGPFRLCLSHTPDNIGWARANQIDLVLAGHVHGGQIRLPLLGSVFVPSRYSRKYDCGTFAEPPTVMHVSRGLAGQHPLRFFCPPEVTRIVLRRAAPG
jgi:hypothetical protein